MTLQTPPGGVRFPRMATAADKDSYSTSEAAEVLGTSRQQLVRWEREGVMPPPSGRVQRGRRWDRVYTREDIETMLSMRSILKAGAPTAEEQAERDRRRAEYLPLRGGPKPPAEPKRLGQ